MRELISSLMRFSGAVTMFSLEQVQNAIGAPADTQSAIVRLHETLDSMSNSLASRMDDSKKAALESMSQAQSEMLNRTFDMVDVDAAEEFMRKTTESLSDAMSGRTNGAKARAD